MVQAVSWGCADVLSQEEKDFLSVFHVHDVAPMKPEKFARNISTVSYLPCSKWLRYGRCECDFISRECRHQVIPLIGIYRICLPIPPVMPRLPLNRSLARYPRVRNPSVSHNPQCCRLKYPMDYPLMYHWGLDKKMLKVLM